MSVSLTEPARTHVEEFRPASLKAIEEDILGTVLRSPDLLDVLREEVDAEHFSTAVGQRIFDAALELNRAGDPVALAAIADRVGVYEWDEPEGINAYLSQLTARNELELGVLLENARAVRAASAARERDAPLYHQDIVAWSHEQRRLLDELSARPGLPAIDWVNVAEEILSVGRSEVSGVARRIELVFVHLIKVASSPNVLNHDRWRLEVDLHLGRLRSNYRPSMRRLLDVDRLWMNVRDEASRQLDDYGERISRSIPPEAPLSLDDLLGPAHADDLILRLPK